MANLFLYGVLSGLLVSVCLYGACACIQLVRSAPDGL